MMPSPCVITGVGLEIPGVAGRESLLTGGRRAEGGTIAVAEKLGRKGVYGKDRATLLALCAVTDALRDAGLPPTAAAGPGPRGVVVSSNLGNADTVLDSIDVLRTQGVRGLRPIMAPNASSNVIAGAIAIWAGCKAINVMICNGATSGLDALYLACIALHAGRARTLLVVGVEVFDPRVRPLFDGARAGAEAADVRRYCDGGACVIVEREEAALARGASPYAVIGRYATGPDLAGSVRALRLRGASSLRRYLTPDLALGGMARRVDQAIAALPPRTSTPERWDLSGALGELYGALGVVQAAAASLWLRGRAEEMGSATVLLSNGDCWGDGAASLVLHTYPDGRME